MTLFDIGLKPVSLLFNRKTLGAALPSQTSLISLLLTN